MRMGLFVAALAIPSLAAAMPAYAAGSAQKGAALVKQRCQMCHVVNKGQKPTIAPNLNGVVGRKAGSSDFAQYSSALKSSKLTWTAAKLDAYLAEPAKLVPGTKMIIVVPNATDRADVIAYLVGNK